MQPQADAAREVAVQILTTLTQHGHIAYLAGGCVRDRLLGLDPKDYDIATDARPEQVLELFARSRYVGEAFGVVLVVRKGFAVEVATFRAEWGYHDKRRPSHVEFTDAQHDAQRRDFTINGLFEDPLAHDGQGRIIDYVGGQDDLKAGVIRAIGDPDRRFAEDYLRMLRAVRFTARFGFTLETRTAAAARMHARYLGQISTERIGQETQMMLTSPAPAAAAALMQQLRLDGPTLKEDHADLPLPTLERLGPHPNYPLALAAWMIDRHMPEAIAHVPDARHGPAHESPRLRAIQHWALADLNRTVARWRTALSLSNDVRDHLRGAVFCLARLIQWTQLNLAQQKRLLAQPCAQLALDLLAALGHDPAARQLHETLTPRIKQLYHQGVRPTPLISGADLIEIGLKPGPQFGKLLDEVYDAQLEGELQNTDDALHWVRRRLMS